mmetsp:Transcript_17829/g.39301  ORF Transcript_17829/g.39301 Transcript_17829/m.39301 type:complete len:108 (-) Transcript_17829:1533-1856(-)
MEALLGALLELRPGAFLGKIPEAMDVLRLGASSSSEPDAPAVTSSRLGLVGRRCELLDSPLLLDIAVFNLLVRLTIMLLDPLDWLSTREALAIFSSCSRAWSVTNTS